MARIGLYTDREVFALGLQSFVHPYHQVETSGLHSLIESAPVSTQSNSDILILDAPPEASHLILRLRSAEPNVPLVVWERVDASEPALNALGSGIQGVLLDASPSRDVIACLESVLAGRIWVPASIAQAVVSSRRCKLTRRESQLVNLVSQGLRNKEIAHSLGISEGTVKVYLSRLFDKLEVSDRYELALLALRQAGSASAGPLSAPTGTRNTACPQSLFVPRQQSKWTNSTLAVARSGMVA